MPAVADTIFALSSGAPPAAIGLIRVSGSRAQTVLKSLIKKEIEPRRPRLCRLVDRSGSELDRALVLWFPGPATATGEDLIELHCHGGRAVVAAVEAALSEFEGLRRAEPGEFTRRAFANGRIDLSEAEGLADLLSAETELQRAAAIQMANGAFSHRVEAWRVEVLGLSAQIEAVLDFADEDDVSELRGAFVEQVSGLAKELREWRTRPKAEKLGEGVRIVLAGPPNAGKSTLFNALTESESAITSPIAGTTRDVIERAVAIERHGAAALEGRSAEQATSEHKDVAGLARAARGMLTQHTPRVIESLPGIEVPSIVVVGADDEPFLAATDYMAAKIPGAEKVIIPAAGHAANMDQPQIFNDAISGFLAANNL